MYRPTRTKPGTTAPMYRSPTDTPMMSPIRIRMMLGGMICPRVPEAQMVPQMSDLS